jgi:hypothetical protein
MQEHILRTCPAFAEPERRGISEFEETRCNRKFALGDTDYRSHQEQQEAIESYLSWRNRSRDISVEEWKSYRRTQKKVA